MPVIANSNDPSVLIEKSKLNNSITTLCYPDRLLTDDGESGVFHLQIFKHLQISFESFTQITNIVNNRINSTTATKEPVLSNDVIENLKTDFRNIPSGISNVVTAQAGAANYTNGDKLLDIFLYIPGNSFKTDYAANFNEFSMTNIVGKLVGSIGAGDSISNALTQQGTQAAIQSAETIYAGVGNNALGSAINRIPNPRVELQYDRPSLRKHRFSFMFLPRNKKESETIKTIINSLKYYMHPELDKSTVFFKVPEEVTVDIMSKMNETPIMRIQRSVIRSLSLDYAGSGVPSFFNDTGEPTSVSMTLELDEINILTKEKIQEGY